MSKKIIEFKNFSFQYQSLGKPTLKKINLDIYEGEKVLIAGPSGSGKSTLGHCLNGLIPFSYLGKISGELSLNGIYPHKTSIFTISNHLSTILQDQDGQFVGLSVGEDVAFRDENHGVSLSKMKENAFSALKKVKMLTHINKAPQELSGGLKQRASLGGIINTGTPILLFDEPLANLDPASGVEAMKLISDIHKSSNKTIIVIEHRIEDVLAENFDRIIIIDDGEIKATGTPTELILNGTLVENGLREPLYIEALRHAGISIEKVIEKKETNLFDLTTFDKEGIKPSLEKWIKEVKFQKNSFKEEILKCENIDFSYNKKDNILKDISFSLYKGEILSLLGNNGAGKSTLSKVITGICKNKTGKILYSGEDIKDWSIRKRGEKIGYVMQNPNHMITNDTLFEEVAFGLKLRGYSPEKLSSKVEDTLKICGLYPFRNWPVSALSYGQKKRLTIASILALDPEVLILDEPTAGQDYHHYLEFMKFIKSITSRGISIIFITHDMHLALEYSDRAIVLSNGEIIKKGDISEVLAHKEVLKQANLKQISVASLGNHLGIDEELILNTFINFEQREGI